MKGIGNLGSMIIVLLVLIASIVGYFAIFPNLSKSVCETDTSNSISNIISKMSLATAQTFTTEFRVGKCIDMINSEGIFFKDRKEVTKFSIPNSNKILTFSTKETNLEIKQRNEPYIIKVLPTPDYIISFQDDKKPEVSE